MKLAFVEISEDAVYFKTQEEFNAWEKENFHGTTELNSYPTRFPCFGEFTGEEREVEYYNSTVYYQIYNWLYPAIESTEMTLEGLESLQD